MDEQSLDQRVEVKCGIRFGEPFQRAAAVLHPLLDDAPEFRFPRRQIITTAPAPVTLLSPIMAPGSTFAPPPTQTLSPMVIGFAASSLSPRGCGFTGCVGVSSCTFGLPKVSGLAGGKLVRTWHKGL